MNRHLLLSLVVPLICNYTISQETEDHIRRNVIKISAASMGILDGMISIDYERNLLCVNYFKLNIEGTYGKFYQTYTKDAFQSLPSFHSFTSSINMLEGKKSHSFEFSLGVRYSIINNDYYENIKPLFPVFNIGYRYQNPYGKGLVFRTFLGTTGIGLSIGKSF